MNVKMRMCVMETAKSASTHMVVTTVWIMLSVSNSLSVEQLHGQLRSIGHSYMT